MPVESAELALLPASICNPNHKDAPKLNSLPQSLINAQEAKDMRVDAQLRAACGGDATQLCADAAQSGVEGAVYDCLVRPGARPGDLVFFFFSGGGHCHGRGLQPPARGGSGSEPAAPCATHALQVDSRAAVTQPCAEQLERAERERAGDLRLARKLVRTCAIELVTFCPGVPLGELVGRQVGCGVELRAGYRDPVGDRRWE